MARRVTIDYCGQQTENRRVTFLPPAPSGAGRELGFIVNVAGLAAHVFFGTAAFGLLIAFDLVSVAIARSRRIETIRIVYEAVRKYAPLTGVSFLLAILLGFYIAAQRHYPLTSKWLLISYGWIIAAGAVNGAIVQRRARNILSAIESSNGAMTASLDRVLSRTMPIGAIVGAIAMFAIIGVMIAKPA
jgi:uncharacterized membrane protein